MYLEGLRNATEVILGRGVRSPDRPAAGGGGSAGRATAGLLRISNTVSAAVTSQRRLEPVETRIMLTVAIILASVGILVAVFPRLVAYPIAVVAIWFAGALFYRSYRLRRRG
jgi:cardiolipin synthase